MRGDGESGSAIRLRSIVASTGGNLVEWFDWFTYSATALYFADDIFPKADPVAQMLNAAAIFAAGFLMRPAGGWLMGRYADRHGRRAALTLSVFLMCLGSLAIACLPTYGKAGLLSPVLLLCARLLQGFSVGGEYGASATYLSEIAPRGRRGLISSFQYVTLILGQILALSVLLSLQLVFLTEESLDAWGWRIPYVVGAAAALFIFWMRRGLEETPQFSAAARHPERGRVAVLLKHPKSVVMVSALTLGGTVAFYTYTTYMQKFLVLTAGLSKVQATLVSLVTLSGYMLMHPLVGALSDRIGRRPVLAAFGVLGAVLTVPILKMLARTESPAVAALLILCALTIVSGYTAVNAVVKAEFFPSHIRATGVGLPYAIVVSLFGGTAEYIALWFKQQGIEEGFYWYVSACIAVSLLVSVLMPEGAREKDLL